MRDVARTRHDTRSPRSISRRTRCSPIKPLAPVTSTDSASLVFIVVPPPGGNDHQPYILSGLYAVLQ
ncbi:MAG TPA: hypothetical protein VK187_08145 [Geobacteraceae bacterium]|nr:hypothetical protein [Geobacteraceae bacterium]